MNTKHIGAQLADRRTKLALTQQQIAQIIGVGRTTVVAMESEKIARVSFASIQAYAKALGLSISLSQQGDDLHHEKMARRLARMEHSLLTEERKTRHLRLAARLTPGLISRARRQVALWASKKTCSPLYIDRWREILAGRREEVAAKIEAAADSEWANALFQNSPFAGAESCHESR